MAYYPGKEVDQVVNPCPCLPVSNTTNNTIEHDFCAMQIPTSSELFLHMPVYGYILMGFLVLFLFLTAGIYFEEIYFIRKTFLRGTRKNKTIWILAFFPVFSATGLLGVFVPRSGTLVDMVANVFFGTCLYSFGRLMVNYMGGPRRMWLLIEDERKVELNTPPCCCCCACLPKVKFDRKKYFKIMILIMQVAIIRPILFFFAAVLWTNGSYLPGDALLKAKFSETSTNTKFYQQTHRMSIYNSYLYITVLNLISTCLAMYGLMIMRGVLRPELEAQFAITGKIVCLQLTLLLSSLPNVIIGILVGTNVIKCGPLFPSKGRGEAIYHTFLVFMMLPFALLGRVFFRRKSDGKSFAKGKPGSKRINPINELATDDEEEIEQTDTSNDYTLQTQAVEFVRLDLPPRYGEQRV